MQNQPRKETVQMLRETYPAGARVELIRMNDPYTKLKQGDKGTVTFVDDMGTIHVNWDSGSTLGVAHGEDTCRKIDYEESPLTETVIEQIQAIRTEGKYNMFDTIGVQHEANEKGFNELVLLIAEHKMWYSAYILTGRYTG